jgi:hypothetical protein
MTNIDDTPPINFDKLTPPHRPEAEPESAPKPVNTLLTSGFLAEDAPPAYTYAYEPAPERPTGVTIIAVLSFLSAALYAVALLLLFGSGDADESGGVIFTSLIQMAVGIIIGVGLWRLSLWAYYLAVAGYVLNIAFTLLSSLSTPITGSTLIGLIIPVIALFYLTRPEVRGAFPR